MELENLGNKISENMADQNLNWIYIVMGLVAKCRVQILKNFRVWVGSGFEIFFGFSLDLTSLGLGWVLGFYFHFWGLP